MNCYEDKNPKKKMESAANIGDYETGLRIASETYSEVHEIYMDATSLLNKVTNGNLMRNKAYYKLLKTIKNHVQEVRGVLEGLENSGKTILTKINSRGGQQ